MPRETNIQIRRGGATDWSEANPVLEYGEPGWDSTNNTLKIGDGTTNWNELSSISPNFYSYQTTIGNENSIEFTINHNLNATIDCFVIIKNNLGEYVYPDIKYVDEDNILLEFNSPLTNDQYTVTIIGVSGILPA